MRSDMGIVNVGHTDDDRIENLKVLFLFTPYILDSRYMLEVTQKWVHLSWTEGPVLGSGKPITIRADEFSSGEQEQAK